MKPFIKYGLSHLCNKRPNGDMDVVAVMYYVRGWGGRHEYGIYSAIVIGRRRGDR
jgi:hypothetical protein